MNQMKKLMALLVALAMMLSVALSVAEDTVPGSTVVATVNGEEIYKSELDDLISYYLSSGYEYTYAEALESLLYEKLMTRYLEDEGYTAFTEEEEAQLREEADSSWEAAMQNYVSYYLSEDTEEARAELYKQAEEYYRSLGYSPDVLFENNKTNAAYTKLTSSLVDADAVTEEEIRQHFEETVAYQKEMIGDSVYMRELYSYYYGDIWYMPAGYRNVLHILLTVDDELLSAYTEANEAYEALLEEFLTQQESDPAEAQEEADEAAETETEAVTQEQVDAAKQARDEAAQRVLDSKKDVLDDIENRLAAGEDFKSLIAEYNEDPGLDVETGYAVHRDSIMWDAAFITGTFSERMTQPGAHSEPVIGSYGIHIVYYLSDAGEAVPLDDEIAAELREEIANELLQEKLQALSQELKEKADLVIDEELMAQLDADAAEEEDAEAVTFDFEPTAE
ncbi:MAG: peptidylprolyl isomerase [Clostridia bacterium]|nr:peptidylprolyl isomerase [Clostridia bacterium]